MQHRHAEISWLSVRTPRQAYQALDGRIDCVYTEQCACLEVPQPDCPIKGSRVHLHMRREASRFCKNIVTVPEEEYHHRDTHLCL